jgi:hypothetical protein
MNPMGKIIVLRKEQKEYLKDLGKDITLFAAGILFGPVVDGTQLAIKHAKKIKEIKVKK